MAVLKSLKNIVRTNLKFGKSKARNKKESLGSTRGGVFVSTRNILVRYDAVTSSADSDDSTSRTSSPPSSWKSSGEKGHNINAALVVSDPEHSEEIKDEALELGRIMARSRQLPSTSYFSSNHVMVNGERSKRVIAPLVRMRELDSIARDYAERMAAQNELFHPAPCELQESFNRRSRRLGENVARGDNIRDIHKFMMATRSDKNNILDRRYTHMGMATAKGSDGKLYLCQIFRG